MRKIRKEQKELFNALLIILGFLFFIFGILIFTNLDSLSKSTTNLMFEPKNKYIKPNLNEKWLNSDFNLNIGYREHLGKTNLTLNLAAHFLIILGTILIFLGIFRLCYNKV